MDCHRSAYLDAKIGKKVNLVSQRCVLDGVLHYADGFYYMEPCTQTFEDGRKHVCNGKYRFRKNFIKTNRWKPE